MHELVLKMNVENMHGEKIKKETMSSTCFYFGSNFKMEGKMLQTVKDSAI